MKKHRGGHGQGKKGNNNDVIKERGAPRSEFKASKSDNEFIEGIYLILI
jgi:hypothetical protein